MKLFHSPLRLGRTAESQAARGGRRTRSPPRGAATDEAVRVIVEKARAAGKRVAIYAATPEDARRYAGFGCEIIAIATDIALLRQASLAAIEAIKG